MRKKLLVLHKYDQYGSITRHEAPEPIAAPHHHEHLEINVVERGQAKYNVNSRIYNLETRGIVFLFPAQEHVLYDRSSDFQMWKTLLRKQWVLKWPMTYQQGYKLRNTLTPYLLI